MQVEGNRTGNNADYIPQLAKVNPEQWGVGVCTIDGQRWFTGDTDVRFCVQSCSKVITYAMAQTLHGSEIVHKHIGKEPSGRSFNEMALDDRGRDEDLGIRKRMMQRALSIENPEKRDNAVRETKEYPIRPSIPHNPLINAGAIMCASLVKQEVDEAQRFDYVMDIWEKLCGYSRNSKTLKKPTFANSTYLSERATADRNFCLAYMMKGANAFPDDVDLVKTLESYFMYCSIECTVNTMSVIAGSLANGGTCPVTGIKVFEPEVVRNCLSLMYTCGMYDYSGEFAFSMGFPCKSGVGGALMIVIPGVCGICTWSKLCVKKYLEMYSQKFIPRTEFPFKSSRGDQVHIPQTPGMTMRRAPATPLLHGKPIVKANSPE